MRRFLLKAALLAFLVTAVLCVGSFVYTHTALYKNIDTADWTDTYSSMPPSIDIAVFGSSHGHFSFWGTQHDLSFFNFSLPAQTPQYDYLQMRQFQDHLHPGSLVVLTMSYMSPFWTESEADFAAKQYRYYRILSPENIVDVDPVRYALQRYLPLLMADPRKLIGSAFRTETLMKDTVDRTFPLSEIPQEKARITDTHWQWILPAFPEGEPVMMDAFRQMLTMCRDNGWTAVLMTPPYLAEYSDCFPEEFYPAFYGLVDDLCQEYGVPYLDYSHDPAYTGRYELFRDLDHLNLAGAEVFNARFFQDIHTMNIS